ncbi:MAG TPA: CBS domain-containing protein [Methanophagales archaeon]|nr:CBS domain-containing protein [Methanophagales archaeon]
MGASIQVGKIIGIPIRLHISLLFILPVFVMMFAVAPGPVGLGDVTDLSQLYRYIFSAMATILFFFSVLLHEMSHSYVAMRYGAKIHSITLFIFGGLAMMDDLPKEPAKEWKIAIAGPAMSFALGGSFLLSLFGIKSVNLSIYDPLQILLFSLGYLNVILATFNLLPAFPMDGGRVLRAVLAKRMSFLKATKKAVLVGKVFAVIMMIVGLMPDPFVLYSTGEVEILFSPFLTFVAIFLYIAATEEERATTTFALLEGIKVKNVMRTEHTCVLEDMPTTELADKMLEEKTSEYAVVGASGEPRGFVTFGEIKDLSAEQHQILKVSDVIGSFDRISDVISEEAEAVEALKRMIKAKRNVLAVEEEASGNFIGLITRNDLATYIEMLKGRV